METHAFMLDSHLPYMLGSDNVNRVATLKEAIALSPPTRSLQASMELLSLVLVGTLRPTAVAA